MTIDRLNSIDPLRDPAKPSSSERVSRAVRGDSIDVSSDAAQKAELYNAMEVAKSAPEVRSDLVAALKAKIQDPGYINDAVVSMTADRILDQFLS
jgi:anti-sigma28 factor (negative regulator of flagellin synthesis)